MSRFGGKTIENRDNLLLVIDFYKGNCNVQ